MNKSNCRVTTGLIFCMMFLLLFSSDVFSAFSISPIRIFFSGQTKTDILTVKNESEEEITLEIKTVLWENRQDYSPTKDIIFFPKMLTLQKGEEKIVRIGYMMPVVQQEKSYRMFIKELPKITPQEGATVQMVMNMGVPIFIQPSRPAPEGGIETIELSNGNLNISIKNRGNVHFLIKSIRVSGLDDAHTEIFNTERAGWYLLAGNSSEYTFEIGKDDCHKIKSLHVAVDTDRLSMEKTFVVGNEKCAP